MTFDLSGLSLAVIHMSDRWGRFRGLESNITLAGLFWARHRPAASPLSFVPPLALPLYDGRRSSASRLQSPQFLDDDLLLPKSGRGRGSKTPLIMPLAHAVWVIKDTQILPKLGIWTDSDRGMILELEGEEYL